MLIDLDPYVFQIGIFSVRWYGLLLAASIGIGFYFFMKHALRLGYDEEFLYNLTLLTIIGGLVGARVVYILANWSPVFAESPLEMLRIDHGGLSWHGTLIGGGLVAWWYIRRNGINFHRLMDLVVPGLAVGYMFGRVGNIFNQEVLGHPTALGFERHPVQIYAVLIGLFLLLLHNYLAQTRTGRPPGYLFWSFVFWHQTLRVLLEEPFRQNPHFWIEYLNTTYGIGFVTLTQWATPFILGFAYWVLVNLDRFDDPEAAGTPLREKTA